MMKIDKTIDHTGGKCASLIVEIPALDIGYLFYNRCEYRSNATNSIRHANVPGDPESQSTWPSPEYQMRAVNWNYLNTSICLFYPLGNKKRAPPSICAAVLFLTWQATTRLNPLREADFRTNIEILRRYATVRLILGYTSNSFITSCNSFEGILK